MSRDTRCPPQLITYRYEDNMVYVTPAKSYERAIQIAQKEFPFLATIDPERIIICAIGTVNAQRQFIRISPMAWEAFTPKLSNYEILQVIVRPPVIVVDSTDGETYSLPAYEHVSEKSLDSDNYYLQPSRSPSPHTKEISVEEFRAASGRASPPRSRSRSRSPGSIAIVTDIAKAMFGKRSPSGDN